MNMNRGNIATGKLTDITDELTEQEDGMIEFEEPTIYNVYARVDSRNRVTKIFSDCFEEAGLNDILLKTGSGDEFVHVGYYQIFNEDGTYKYKIENWELIERTEEDREEELYSSNINTQIAILKENLTKTDYIAMKYAEGWISEKEYVEVKTQRQEWRDKINQLEIEQANLNEV